MIEIKEQYTKYLWEIICFIFIFFAPIQHALITVVFLGLFDFITGVWASCVNRLPITSRKMFRSIVKVTLYSILIIASHAMELYMLTYLPLVKLATSTIAFVELKSLYENISIVLGYDLWGKVKDVLDKKNDNK